VSTLPEDCMPPIEYRNTVYVHGAGKQEDPILWKRRIDGLIFGGPQGDKTHLGYYSDVLHGRSAPATGLERRRVDAGLEVAADPLASRADVVAAIAPSAAGPLERAGDERRARLVDALIAQADEVAAREADVAYGGLEGKRFPDIGFRIVVGILARDVIQYLFDGEEEAVREPIREAIRAAADPVLIIAHSLGTIVTFDVLSEPEFANREVVRLVTLGCPLGIENVQDELVNGVGQPNRIPAPIQSWLNLADKDDPVATGQFLEPEFDPNGYGFRIIDDLTVKNAGFVHHELTGYLAIDAVRTAIGVS
jgi:hypothetical protein